MNALFYSIYLQWKLDLRNKEILLTYYIVPLVFFGFMGGIFTSIDPSAKNTLIQSMTVFGVSMGAFLGTPVPLVEIYGSDIKKSYKIGNIPLWMTVINNFISALIHLFIMSSIIFILAPIIYKAKLPTNIPLYFFSLIIFIKTCVAVGSILGLYVKSTSKLAMIAQLIFLPSIMLSGIMFPSEMLPSMIGKLGRIFPATWGFKIMQLDTIDLSSILALGLILLVSIIICAYRIFNLKLD